MGGPSCSFARCAEDLVVIDDVAPIGKMIGRGGPWCHILVAYTAQSPVSFVDPGKIRSVHRQGSEYSLMISHARSEIPKGPYAPQ